MTTSITADQLQFLTRHNLKVSSVFDAQGMKRKDYMEAMRELNKFVAINVTPCKAMGHTMRTRHGRCIQCNPKAIAFSNRYNAHGSVYIAGSLKGKIVKVGFSLNPATREQKLNGDRYGGRDDWKLLYTVTCDLAGKVEFSAHAELKKFNTPGTYRNYASKPSQCFELFDCDFTVAKKAIEKSLAYNGLLDSASPWENTAHLGRYDFSVSKTIQAKQATQTPATKLTATQKIKNIDKKLASPSVIASNVSSKGKAKRNIAKNKKSGRPAVNKLNSGNNTQKQAEPKVETPLRGRTVCSQKPNEATQLLNRHLQVNQAVNPITVIPSRNTKAQTEPLATPPKYTPPSEHQYTSNPKPNEAIQQVERVEQTPKLKDTIPLHKDVDYSEAQSRAKNSVSIWESRCFRLAVIIVILIGLRIILELLSAE
ncbi:GIY-YIG nuclease family protein [Vibrio breoganii]|nr:hypothetical protein BCT64_17655 [Vibrio breoganii]PMN67188.1 hypothetical protein BCT28_03715 [Vibrio breoganii]